MCSPLPHDLVKHDHFPARATQQIHSCDTRMCCRLRNSNPRQYLGVTKARIPFVRRPPRPFIMMFKIVGNSVDKLNPCHASPQSNWIARKAVELVLFGLAAIGPNPVQVRPRSDGVRLKRHKAKRFVPGRGATNGTCLSVRAGVRVLTLQALCT